jgi:hypothetical protein
LANVRAEFSLSALGYKGHAQTALQGALLMNERDI